MGFSLGFDIVTFLKNAANYLKEIGHYVMIVAGIILIIIAAIQIAKGLASGGKGQVNWVMSIGCLLAGGALAIGGWNLMASLSQAGADTLNEIGGGSGLDGGADGADIGAGFEPAASAPK